MSSDRKEEETIIKMTNSVFSSCSLKFDWRLVLLTISLTFLIVFFSISTSPTNPFFQTSLRGLAGFHSPPPGLPNARVAVCLVGGARRFELTGPSIIQNVLEHFPNSDLFLLSPLDKNTFKLSLLRASPRIASVKIFEQKPINVTESMARVLDPGSSPNGYQGLLQYFNLVEGCLTLIKEYQKAQNMTYEWIVRTRVDGYWSAPLDPNTFVPGEYTIPIGSSYGGLNDRLGVGDLNTSAAGLSRLSLIPELDTAGFKRLNSESSFKAQFTTSNVSVSAKRFPFCVMSDRWFGFPPGKWGLPVAAISSRGPLNGAYCRPCKAACKGECAAKMADGLVRGWSWIEAGHGTDLEICDAHSPWGDGWEESFDAVAGDRLVAARKRVIGMSLEDCITGFEDMKRRSTGSWDVPSPEIVCSLGLNRSR